MNRIRRWLRDDSMRFPKLVAILSVIGLVWAIVPVFLQLFSMGDGQSLGSGAIIFVFLVVISLIHGRDLERRSRS